PDIVGEPEGLEASLCGPDKVEQDTHKEKGQYVGVCNSFHASPHGHQKVDGTGKYRDEHASTKDNGNCLEPPGKRAENKVMCTNHSIEQHLCPKGEYS